MGERLDPRAEPRAGPPHPFGHRPDPAVPAGQQGHDPVGFTEFLGPKDHGFVTVKRHPTILPCRLLVHRFHSIGG